MTREASTTHHDTTPTHCQPSMSVSAQRTASDPLPSQQEPDPLPVQFRTVSHPSPPCSPPQSTLGGIEPVKRHTHSTKQNAYTECGRHGDEWLFGGFPESGSLKKLWGLEETGVPQTPSKSSPKSKPKPKPIPKPIPRPITEFKPEPEPKKPARNVDKAHQTHQVASTVNPTPDPPSQSSISISGLSKPRSFKPMTYFPGIPISNILPRHPKKIPSSAKRLYESPAETQASSSTVSFSYFSTKPPAPSLQQTIATQARQAFAKEQLTLQQAFIDPSWTTHANVEEFQVLPTLDTTEEMGSLSKNERKSTGDSSPLSQPKSITDSTCSEDETDWEEDVDADWIPLYDLLDIRPINVGGEENNEPFTSRQITSTKGQLVDRLMEAFWPIFDQHWRPELRRRGTRSESSSSSSNSAPLRQCLSKGKGVKRFRGDGDEEDPGEESKRPSKRQIESSESPHATENTPPFACPFRKHNPRKYCIKDWARCALTAQPTVARVK
jgi:hypothetical protein